MITIIYDEKGKDMSLQASTRGLCAERTDIVCAAVSTLMQSLAYSVDSGTVTCDPGGTTSCVYRRTGALDTLAKFELVIDKLYLLAQQYPENAAHEPACKRCRQIRICSYLRLCSSWQFR